LSFAKQGFLPVLQVDNSLNTYLRHVVEIEENVCKHRKSQKNCRCDHE
jgi:hypothetical protein